MLRVNNPNCPNCALILNSIHMVMLVHTNAFHCNFQGLFKNTVDTPVILDNDESKAPPHINLKMWKSMKEMWLLMMKTVNEICLMIFKGMR